MLKDDFIARVGGSVKRRHKNDTAWRDYEVKNEEWATYYHNLQQHGFEYRL
jgi:hypothetical protein